MLILNIDNISASNDSCSEEEGNSNNDKSGANTQSSSKRMLKLEECFGRELGRYNSEIAKRWTFNLRHFEEEEGDDDVAIDGDEISSDLELDDDGLRCIFADKEKAADAIKQLHSPKLNSFQRNAMGDACLLIKTYLMESFNDNPGQLVAGILCYMAFR